MYQAVLYWKIENGVVYVKEPAGYIPTNIPVRFVKDFELPDNGQAGTVLGKEDKEIV